MNISSIKHFVLLFVLFSVFSVGILFGQDSDIKFYKKGFYNEIFGAKEKKQLDKVNTYNIKGNKYLSESKEYYKEVDKLEKIASESLNESAKAKALKKAEKIEKKANSRKKRALKFYSKANVLKNQVYVSKLPDVRLTDHSDEAEKALRLEKEAANMFVMAETKKNAATAYTGTDQLDLLLEANNIERTALKKLEGAFGLYKRDTDYRMAYIVSEVDTVRTVTIEEAKNEKKQLVYVPDDSGSEVSKNQYQPKVSDVEQKNLESMVLEKINLSDEDKDKLKAAEMNNQIANDVMREVDEMYIEIDDYRTKSKAAESTKERESLASEAAVIEMKAFSKMLRGVRMHLGVNEIKYDVYKKYIPNVRITNSTLESKRGNLLEKEAESYYKLSRGRIKLAEKEQFHSEKYTYLMEANNLVISALKKYERAFGLYLNIEKLTDKDIALVTTSFEPVFFDDNIGDNADYESPLVESVKSRAQNKKQTVTIVKQSTKPSGEKKFNFEVGRIYVLDKNDKDTLAYKADEGLVFKIQIGIFKTLPEKALDVLRPATAEVFAHNPFTRFYLGKFKSYETAEYALDEVQKKLFKDAYVVGFNDGKRTSLKRAKQLIVDEKIMPLDEYKKLSYVELNYYKKHGKTRPAKRKVAESGEEIADAGELSKLKGLIYTVQIGVFKDEPTTKQVYNIDEIYRDKIKQGYRYTAGLFHNLSDAKAMRKRINKLGNKEAFVIAYDNGKLISLNQAKKRLKTKKTPAELPKGIVYKIQIGDFESSLSGEEFDLKYGEISKKHTISLVQDYKNNRFFYTIGEYKKLNEAKKLQKQLEKIGLVSLIAKFKGNEYLNYSSESNKAIKKTKTSPKKGKQFKVQIAAFDEPLSKTEMKSSFKKIPKGYKVEGTYQKSINKTIYTVGSFDSYNDAAKCLEKLKSAKVDGFVITMIDNKRVDLMVEKKSPKPEKKKETTQKTISKKETSKKTSKGTEYRIQIGAFSRKLSNTEIQNTYPGLPGGKKVEYYYDNETNRYLYTVGNFPNYDDAGKFSTKLKEKGINGFVVIFEGDTKLSFNTVDDNKTKDEKTIEKENKQKEKTVEKTVKVSKSEGFCYRIQLMAINEPLSASEQKAKFSKVPSRYKIIEIKDAESGNYLYTLGKYEKYAQAVDAKKKLKNSGVYGFVIALENSKKISIVEARRRE